MTNDLGMKKIAYYSAGLGVIGFMVLASSTPDGSFFVGSSFKREQHGTASRTRTMTQSSAKQFESKRSKLEACLSVGAEAIEECMFRCVWPSQPSQPRLSAERAMACESLTKLKLNPIPSP